MLAELELRYPGYTWVVKIGHAIPLGAKVTIVRIEAGKPVTYLGTPPIDKHIPKSMRDLLKLL